MIALEITITDCLEQVQGQNHTKTGQSQLTEQGFCSQVGLPLSLYPKPVGHTPFPSIPTLVTKDNSFIKLSSA